MDHRFIVNKQRTDSKTGLLLSLQFPAMREVSIVNSEAFILVYDLTREETFEECSQLRDQIYNVKHSSTTPIVIVGNKLDIMGDDHEVK